MSAHHHAVVWVDHDEARIFQIDAATPSRIVLHSHVSLQRLHHRENPDPRAPPPVDKQFYDRIAAALDHAGGTLITGPGNAKYELDAYLRQHRPALATLVNAENLRIHPGDAALMAIAASRFPVVA